MIWALDTTVETSSYCLLGCSVSRYSRHGNYRIGRETIGALWLQSYKSLSAHRDSLIAIMKISFGASIATMGSVMIMLGICEFYHSDNKTTRCSFDTSYMSDFHDNFGARFAHPLHNTVEKLWLRQNVMSFGSAQSSFSLLLCINGSSVSGRAFSEKRRYEVKKKKKSPELFFHICPSCMLWTKFTWEMSKM